MATLYTVQYLLHGSIHEQLLVFTSRTALNHWLEQHAVGQEFYWCIVSEEILH